MPIHQPTSNTHFKGLVIKTTWYWHKYRQENQNRGPKSNLHVYNQVVFNRGIQNTNWRKDIPFNKWYWENWIPPAEE